MVPSGALLGLGLRNSILGSSVSAFLRMPSAPAGLAKGTLLILPHLVCPWAGEATEGVEMAFSCLPIAAFRPSSNRS